MTFTVDNGAMVAKVTNLSLDYTTNFSYNHKIVEGELISAGMSSPNTSITYSYGLQARGQVSGSKTVEEVLLTGERWFWVGWLPIQVKDTLFAKLTFTGGINLDYQYTNQVTDVYNIGAFYNNGGFEGKFDEVSSVTDLNSSDLTMSVSGGVKLSLENKSDFLILGVLGPFAEVAPYAKMEGSVNNNLDWNAGIGGGVDGKVGVKLNLYTLGSSELSYDGNIFGGNLLEFPSKLTLISGNNQEGSAGQQLSTPLKFQVTNNVDAPMSNVNVYFQVSSGGGTVDNDHVKTNDQGIAEVNWTLGQDGTDQQLAATNCTGNTTTTDAVMVIDVCP